MAVNVLEEQGLRERETVPFTLSNALDIRNGGVTNTVQQQQQQQQK